jgi:hypothetical protein
VSLTLVTTAGRGPRGKFAGRLFSVILGDIVLVRRPQHEQIKEMQDGCRAIGDNLAVTSSGQDRV